MDIHEKDLEFRETTQNENEFEKNFVTVHENECNFVELHENVCNFVKKPAKFVLVRGVSVDLKSC